MTARESFKVSAPGSLMLFGEHAVLRERPAIACGVDRRISITVTPRSDGKVRIRSALGHYDEHMDELEVVPPFTFMLTAIQNDPVFTGATFEVVSDFSSAVGLGSSAAVTVATVTALRHMRGLEFDRKDIFEDSILEVRQAQGGRGSGTDVAASVMGGLVYYRMNPREMIPIEVTSYPAISLIYCGYKVSTPEVISQVNLVLDNAPQKGPAIFDAMERITDQARKAITREDWPEVGTLMNAHQEQQRALAVSNEDIEDILTGLHESEGILGAKISGSGLGDCVVGLGSAAAEVATFEKIPVAIGQKGVVLE